MSKFANPLLPVASKTSLPFARLLAKKPAVEPLTSPIIKHLVGVGLSDPSKLSLEQMRSICASVMAHIEPRKTGR